MHVQLDYDQLDKEMYHAQTAMATARRRLHDNAQQMQALMYENSQLKQQLPIYRPRQEAETTGQLKRGRKRKLLQTNIFHATEIEGCPGLTEEGAEKQPAVESHTARHYDQDFGDQEVQITDERPLKQRRLDNTHVVQSLTLDDQACVTRDIVIESYEPGKSRKRG